MYVIRYVTCIFIPLTLYLPITFTTIITTPPAMQKRLEDESMIAVANVEKIAMAMLANAGGGGAPSVSLTELLTALTHDQGMSTNFMSTNFMNTNL